MKRIVIFADGTWESPEDTTPTNVCRMARGVAPDADGVPQIVFYDWGVGADRKQLTGGLTGAGIDKNIMDCYRFLVHNYQPGDQLYFFGFSRGAYTVRSLAGFIRNCGILGREHADRIPAAYRLYRERSGNSGPDAPKAVKFRRDYAVEDRSTIELVGVWDTVGSLGIPIAFWGELGGRNVLFHDTEPSGIIRHARHAVSVDENREDFQPALWDTKRNIDLRQVWFAGVHSDVGGGYKQTGLSDCAFQWMLREATALGLRFESHLSAALHPDAAAKQHNELKGLWRLRGDHVRRVAGPVHRSVRERWEADAHGYRRKSKALARLLQQVDGDWRRIDVVD